MTRSMNNHFESNTLFHFVLLAQKPLLHIKSRGGFALLLYLITIVAGVSFGDGRICGYVAHAEKGNTPLPATIILVRKTRGGQIIAKTKTDEGGIYRTPQIKAGTYVVDVQKQGFREAVFDNVAVVSGKDTWENANLFPLTIDTDQNYRITLSWCKEKRDAVQDVDSYLLIPGVQVPLSYKAKGKTYQGTFLDVDDTSWIGPETITIRAQRPGRYVYYVNNYNNRRQRRALGNSRVKIQLYRGNSHVRTFNIPEGSGITYEVFNIEGSKITNVEKYNDSLPIH